MKKKKAFLLLELLIAVTLVSTCSLLIGGNPMKIMLSDVSSLEKIELHRISENSLAKIKTDLYQNKIPWKGLEKYIYENPEEVKLSLLGFSKNRFKEIHTFEALAHKEGENGEESLKLKVTIAYVPKSKRNKNDADVVFHHHLIVGKK